MKNKIPFSFTLCFLDTNERLVNKNSNEVEMKGKKLFASYFSPTGRSALAGILFGLLPSPPSALRPSDKQRRVALRKHIKGHVAPRRTLPSPRGGERGQRQEQAKPTGPLGWREARHLSEESRVQVPPWAWLSFVSHLQVTPSKRFIAWVRAEQSQKEFTSTTDEGERAVIKLEKAQFVVAPEITLLLESWTKSKVVSDLASPAAAPAYADATLWPKYNFRKASEKLPSMELLW
ncbi:Protein of unknown function [Gryllus bimaculatus]|nr:Protein of unknown function [Gryllus bimaculatus]